MKQGLMLVAVLMLVALACSSSHHSSDAPASPVSLWGEGNASFGTWTCQDACGCQLPEDFKVLSFTDIKANDLCGSAFSCHYRCSADCACQKADLNGSGRVDIYDLNIAAHDSPEEAQAVAACQGFTCGG